MATAAQDADQSRGQTKNEVKFESIAAKKSPTMVTQNLKGISFPATKDDLITRAKANNAPEAVLENIQKLPEGDYQQMIDVTHNLGKVL